MTFFSECAAIDLAAWGWPFCHLLLSLSLLHVVFFGLADVWRCWLCVFCGLRQARYVKDIKLCSTHHLGQLSPVFVLSQPLYFRSAFPRLGVSCTLLTAITGRVLYNIYQGLTKLRFHHCWQRAVYKRWMMHGCRLQRRCQGNGM